MFSIFKPSSESVAQIIREQTALPFTYAAVGATGGTPPADFQLDRERITLGNGEAVFEKAKSALRRWEQVKLGWVEAFPDAPPIAKDAMIATAAWSAGLWCLNV